MTVESVNSIKTDEIFNSELDGKKSLLITACGSIFMIILGIVLHFFVKVKVQGAVNEFLLSIIPVEMFLGGYLGVNHLFNYKDKRVVTVGGAINISILLVIANMNVNGFVYVFSRLLALIIIVLVIVAVVGLLVAFDVFQKEGEEIEEPKETVAQQYRMTEEDWNKLDPVVQQALEIRLTTEMIDGTLFEVGDNYFVIERNIPKENQEKLIEELSEFKTLEFTDFYLVSNKQNNENTIFTASNFK